MALLEVGEVAAVLLLEVVVPPFWLQLPFPVPIQSGSFQRPNPKSGKRKETLFSNLFNSVVFNGITLMTPAASSLTTVNLRVLCWPPMMFLSSDWNGQQE